MQVGHVPVGVKAANGLSTHVVLIRSDARLANGASDLIEAALTQDPEIDCIYGDVLVSGSPQRLAAWSVERSRWQHYTGPLMAVRRELWDAWSRDDVDPFIGIPRRAARVLHIPHILSEVDEDDLRDLTAVERALAMDGLPYSVAGNSGRPRRRPLVAPSVSIVIPTRGSSSVIRGRRVVLIDECLAALAPTLDSESIDVVLVVDADATLPSLPAWQQQLGSRLSVVVTDPPFNFSSKIAAGVAASNGEVLVLLNDDVEAISSGWLDEMVSVALESDVGAVGALLLLEDGRVQHRGHVFAAGGVHLAEAGEPVGPGLRRQNECDRDVSGVTAACMVQRREVWERAGGLDPAFPVAFNDVDYCERLRSAGFRIVLCNSAVLHHFESRTRPGHAQVHEVGLLRQRWSSSLDLPDPFTPGTARVDGRMAPIPYRALRLRRAVRSWFR